MTFDEAVDFIIDHIEGGYANNPRDKGGETNWGISVRAHPQYAGQIKDLTREEAKEVYFRDYYLPVKLMLFPEKTRLVVLDCAINLGVPRTRKFVQVALNKIGFDLAEDGIIGPNTLAAIQAADPALFNSAFSRIRQKFVRKLDDYEWAGESWENRILLACAAA
jgi:lysozyme family protein